MRLALRGPALRAAIAALACASWWGAFAAAQDDAGEGDEEASTADRFEISEEVFDSYVFSRGFSQDTAETVRVQLESQLQLQLDDVDRIVKLDEARRAKLRLAGRADIKRYFDEVERLRSRFAVLRKNRDKFNEFWREVQPFRTKLLTGIFDDGSLLRKALGKVLGPEDAARCEKAAGARREYRHRAEIEWVVEMMEGTMPLGEEQRANLLKLLAEKTRPGRTPGEYDPYIILWQMYRLPEETLKPIFSDAQWGQLVRQFTHLKGVWDHLRKSGRLPADGEPAAAADEAGKD